MDSVIRPEHYINLERPQHHVPKAAVPSMGAVSNRRFIERMIDWGWEVNKASGEKSLMTLPTGDEVWVMSAHVHRSNPLSVFNAVLRITGDISWETFWTLDVIAELRKVQDDLRAEIEAEERRIAKRERKHRKEKQRRMPTTEPARVINLDSGTDVTEELKRLEAEVPEERERRIRVQPRVLALLMESGEPWAVSNIAKHLNAPDSSISGACGRLVQSGLLTRVAHGVYQAVRTGSDHKVHISVGTALEAAQPGQPVDVALAPESPSAARTAPATTATETPVDGQWDETINEVLDLMFPNGFKARHLPLIDRWRRATVALLRELNS
jgi:hypothetical protein